MTKKVPDPDKGPYGTGLKIGIYWWDGTEKHKQFIERSRHVAAVKMHLKKSHFVENNDLTEEELSGTATYTPGSVLHQQKVAR